MKTATTPKRTVLAVDDDDVNLAILIKIAGDGGYNVKPFASAEAAWDFLERNPREIDIAVLDKMMPGVSGMELLARIKRSPALKHIPVIMQTGDVGEAQMREGLENGAYYYLAKPFRPEILTAILNSAENECNLRAELLVQFTQGQGKFVTMLQDGDFMFRSHAEARLLAATLAQASGCPELVARGLTELFYNAIEHGCLEIGAQMKNICLLENRWWQEVAKRMSKLQNRFRMVQVHVHRNTTAINLTITDPGRGFNTRYYLDTASALKLNDPSGRGIVIADRLLRNLRYNDQGNEAQCAFTLKGHSSVSYQKPAQEEQVSPPH